MNINELEARLSDKGILTSKEQTSIKGGKRLICRSHNRIMAKIRRLNARGVSSHLQMTPDGDYCLDW